MPKIVITGGPCAGKTTLVNMIGPKLERRGYRVQLVGECATEVLAQGLNPSTCGSVLEFQRHVADLQLKKEKALEQLDPEVVVILDRGLMDSAGYLSDEEFDLLLAERGMTRADGYARYDAVVHLVTAAIGAEEFFSHATNEQRMEDSDEAVRVDRATLRGWSGHPKLQVIDNEGSFEDKLARATAAVLAAAGAE